MKKISIAILFCCSFSFTFAQLDVSGQWYGTITQDEGGFRSQYDFEIYFIQKGNQITGRSYVYADDLHAVMDLKGELQANQYIKLEELKIVEHTEMEGMEWCVKRAQLFLKKDQNVLKLEGDWQGNTSFGACIPGKIFLKKIKTVP